MKISMSKRNSKTVRNWDVCRGLLSLVSRRKLLNPGVCAWLFLFSASINAGTFLDDFNDGRADGWVVFAGTWEVIDGEYKMTEETNGPPLEIF